MSLPRTLALAAALLSPLALPLSAQQTKPTVAQRTIEEKIRPEWLRGLEGTEAEQALSSLKSADEGETIVSGGSEVESEVHAAMNPLDTSNIIVSPIRSGGSPSDGVQCPIYFTRDFGRTWSKSNFKTVPIATPSTALGGGDPVLAFDANGTAYITWLAFYFKGSNFNNVYFTMFWARSTDGGATWQRSQRGTVVENQGTLSGSGVVVDKQWMAVDRTSGTYHNTLYTAFLEADQESGVNHISLRWKRGNDQEFTESSVNVSGDAYEMVQFTDIDVDPDGGVHVSFFGSTNGQEYALYHVSSNDGGQSFSQPVKVSDLYVPNFNESGVTIAGIEPSRIYPCPHIAIDRSNGPHRGSIYAVWTAWGKTHRDGNGLDVYLSRSNDNGATWSEPISVNDDPRGIDAQQYYPSIAVSPRGVVAVTWYDRRGDASQLNTNYMIAYSFDGGATFTPNHAVSTQPTDFSTVGSLNSRFGVGEYTQVLTTNDYAIPVWTDGRNNNGDLDIYAAVVGIGSGPSGVQSLTSVDERYAIGEATINAVGELRLPVQHLPDGIKLDLELVALDGRTLGNWHDLHAVSGGSITVQAGTLPAGRYLLRVAAREGMIAVRSLVVVR